MSARLLASVTFVLIMGSAIVIIHDRTRHLTARSSRLGNDGISTETTMDTGDDDVPKASGNSESNAAAFPLFGKSETDEKNSFQSFAGEDDFSLIMNNLNSALKEKVMKRELVETRSARRRRSVDDAGSSQLTHLTVALKALESENTQLKATVKELQGASRKFMAKAQEIETKSNLAISQQMTQAAAAHQQQQLALGQLQLQLSQLSTNTMKLRDENEALRTRLQSLTSDVTAGERQRSALHEKVEMLQLQASLLASNVSEIKSGSTRTVPREPEYSLAGRRVPQTK